MKKFNIVKQHFKLYGKMMPINAVYGEYVLPNTTYSVIYCVEDFGYKIKHVDVVTYDEKSKSMAHVQKSYHYYDILIYDDINDKWVHRTTCNPKYRALYDFLTPLFVRNGLDVHTDVLRYKPKDKIVGQPRIKTNTYNDIFKVPSVGYALSPYIITDGVCGWNTYKGVYAEKKCNAI